MKEIVKKPIEGYFIIEQLDKDGNVLTRYEDNNMIMLDSKIVITSAITGVPDLFIDSLVLGTGALPNQNFNNSQVDIFSRLNGAVDTVYPISWDGAGIILGEGYDTTGTPEVPTDISTLIIETLTPTGKVTVEYKIVIPIGNANGQTYTEAGLYSKLNSVKDPAVPSDVSEYGTLFAMKTFDTKIKTNAESFRINWKITF